MHYNTLSKLLHWTTAILILGLLALGFYMAQLDYSDDKIKLYGLHKSFGLLVLMLGIVRVTWHLLVKKPKSLPEHKKWEKGLSHAVHALLYLCIFAIPLSGWIMSSAGDFAVQFFGINMPDIVAKDKELFETSGEVHETLAFIVLCLAGLHFLGAAKHHIIDRDQTLTRMTSPNLSLSRGIVICGIIGALFLPPIYFIAQDILHEEDEHKNENDEAAQQAPIIPASTTENTPLITSLAPRWTIVPNENTVSFTATQSGAEFSGHFGAVKGDIFFDPENLPHSKAKITIQIAPISTGSDDRDAQAVQKDWFDATTFPIAIFETTSFEKTGDDTFTAHGNLTIREITKPVDLSFTLLTKEEQGNTFANMTAQLSLKRTDFGVGQGQWQSTDTIGDDVKITINLFAQQEKR